MLRFPPLLLSCALLALGRAGDAAAAVVHLDLSAAPLAIPNTLDGLYLNVVTGQTSTASPPPGWDFNPYNRGDGLGFFAPSAPSGQGTLASGPTALALLGGETIGPSNIFQPDQALGTNFQITGLSYVGFRFLNESTGLNLYGWAQIRTAGGSGLGFPAALLGYAYEDRGASILAGQVPEPTGPALLSFAALAALAARGRPRDLARPPSSEGVAAPQYPLRAEGPQGYR